MILLTRLGGPVFALNPDLVERVDCTPDTLITLVDGKKYLVGESLPEVISIIRQFRATIVADAQAMTGAQTQQPDVTPRAPHAVTENDEHVQTDAEKTNVLQLHRRER